MSTAVKVALIVSLTIVGLSLAEPIIGDFYDKVPGLKQLHPILTGIDERLGSPLGTSSGSTGY